MKPRILTVDLGGYWDFTLYPDPNRPGYRVGYLYFADTVNGNTANHKLCSLSYSDVKSILRDFDAVKNEGQEGIYIQRNCYNLSGISSWAVEIFQDKNAEFNFLAVQSPGNSSVRLKLEIDVFFRLEMMFRSIVEDAEV